MVVAIGAVCRAKLMTNSGSVKAKNDLVTKVDCKAKGAVGVLL